MDVLIIEDELRSAKRLEKMILEYDTGINILGIIDSIEAAVSWFQTHKDPDLVFLDIQLADGESFSIFREVDVDAPIIFTTAYNEYAMDAFRLNSIDYLLKPINKEQLVQALKKYGKYHGPGSAAYRSLSETSPYTYLKRMMIRIGATIKSIEIEQTAYFYIQDRITYAVLIDGSKYPLEQSLEKLEKQINPERFFRINRQFIISFNSIKKMVAYSKSRIKISLDPPCEVDSISSSEKTAYFRDWLDGKNLG